jgi:hypothetical protein
MSAQHTPGPWFTFANGQCIGGPVGPLGNPSGAETAGIAHCGMGLRTGTEIQANARLISAAPELLETLRELVEAYCRAGTPLSKDERHEDRLRLIAARVAISNAIGERP